ncbi:MAG: hypothetical protein HRU76_12490 [Phycisphaeraceae bacterium]|nr:hypothetical protein [Phycisphaerales bacterium]QOJ18356.1 MAG: hypothetical protein HRU76_12490 [Phycisphaeraceae bacterium]
MNIRTWIGMAVAALATGSAAAGSLTTLFASNNRGSNGGMVYFTVTVLNSNGIRITGFDINNTAGPSDTIAMDVYTRVGGHSGFELNQGAWTLTSSGSGNGAGVNNPAFINVTDFVLGPGTYGMALRALHNGTATSGHEYTNGTGGNQNFGNADLTIALGSATNAAFGPSVFQPRVWNGTIYYEEVPAPGALALLGLAGLTARRRRRG